MKKWRHKKEIHYSGVCGMCNPYTDAKQWVNINGTRRKLPVHKIYEGCEIYVTEINHGHDEYRMMITDSKGNEYDIGNINASMLRPGSVHHLVLKRGDDGVLAVHWAHYRAYIDRLYSNTQNIELNFSRIRFADYKRIQSQWEWQEVVTYWGKAPKGMTHEETTAKQGEAA